MKKILLKIDKIISLNQFAFLLLLYQDVFKEIKPLTDSQMVIKSFYDKYMEYFLPL